jgi:hypothetical protein
MSEQRQKNQLVLAFTEKGRSEASEGFPGREWNRAQRNAKPNVQLVTSG